MCGPQFGQHSTNKRTVRGLPVDKIWLKNYPPGVPAEINPDEYTSLVAILEESCGRFAELPAFTSMDKTITYAEYDRLSRNFAAWLQQSAKLQRGDRDRKSTRLNSSHVK